MNYNEIYELWIKSADKDTADELKGIDEKEKEDRFYKSLEFGTGGLRGVIGAGTNRMNKYTVGQATQALAAYLNARGLSKSGVCISYDSRLYSDVFAKESACILAANGIKAYLSDALRPVPFLSFSVLQKGAAAGQHPFCAKQGCHDRTTFSGSFLCTAVMPGACPHRICGRDFV